LQKSSSERTLEFFCRHLVALCISYRPIKNGVPLENVSFIAYPGTVICIGDFFSFLTAGHALKNLNEHLERGDILVDSSVLTDTFGPGAISDKPIPFDITNEPLFFIDDEDGLDFGLIALKPYYMKLLAKNGIIALFEENWINQHNVKYDSYTMLGLPEELVSIEQGILSGESTLIAMASPTMIGVKKLDSAPDTIKITRYSQFIGQIDKNLPLSSIVGMSGGPIFGFRHGPPMTYWVIAIQSSWLKSKGIIFGCSLPVLAGLLTEWIDDLSKSDEFKSVSE
jgi:hypothetical protein